MRTQNLGSVKTVTKRRREQKKRGRPNASGAGAKRRPPSRASGSLTGETNLRQ
ncbi:hypothetical protein AKJ09_06443 [Labilithrix luteola]|uniref:Uncharacterized protein n=1 Tax=Labilithrix luteola TaxID=1391654 RepID=A0A0K1Q320_9BACT|nr:hypothetical protein AKJ09_06443 [Labilithrix luteola]